MPLEEKHQTMDQQGHHPQSYNQPAEANEFGPHVADVLAVAVRAVELE
jgi:hypothetical protein